MSAQRRCAVIGAGIVGASLALRLAEAGGPGWAVTLLDRDDPGTGTTRSSMAWVNSNDKHPRSYHDLNHAGIRAWAELADRLGAGPSDAGPSAGGWHHPVGNLAWAESDAGRAELADRVRRLAAWGYPARLVDPDTAHELEPAVRLPATVSEVGWFEGEAYLGTGPLVARLVERAREFGVTVATGRAGEVTAIRTPAAGAAGPVEITTADGETTCVDTVVCCAGRWTPDVLALAGAGTADAAPLVRWSEPGSPALGLVVLVGPGDGRLPGRVLHAPTFCTRPDDVGLHLQAPDAPVDLHTPATERQQWAERLLGRARDYLPGLAGARVLEHRVCVRPLPSDGHPIVGWLPGSAHVYVVVTHSGVTLAAHLAGLVSAELTRGLPSPELAEYRPDRFGRRDYVPLGRSGGSG